MDLRPDPEDTDTAAHITTMNTNRSDLPGPRALRTAGYATHTHTHRQLAVTEAELVEACVEMRESRGTVDAMVEAFDGAIIYCERPERLGLMLRTVPGLGTWTAVFSSLERLKRRAGECLWLSTTGADLREQIHPGIGILVDIDDEHTVAIPFASTAELSGGNDE